jgi:hypothetical protein
LLATLFTVTTTFPVVAPEGTVAVMLLVVHELAVAVVPLNVTVLLPWLPPKLDPVMVTEVPTTPEVGERLLMLGDGTVTMKFTPLLATPFTVTTTFPVVAPEGTVAVMLLAVQELAVAAVPLNFTVLLPWLEPKLAPAMVTEVPTAPEVGERLLMLGVLPLAGELNATASHIQFPPGGLPPLFKVSVYAPDDVVVR